MIYVVSYCDTYRPRWIVADGVYKFSDQLGPRFKIWTTHSHLISKMIANVASTALQNISVIVKVQSG